MLSDFTFAHAPFNFISLYLLVLTRPLKLKHAKYLRPMKKDVRFEYFPWRNVWFCFTSTVWLHFSYKTEKFWFWKSLKYFNVFDKKGMASDLNICHGIMSDFVPELDFEDHWRTLIFFDKKSDVRFEYVLSNSV